MMHEIASFSGESRLEAAYVRKQMRDSRGAFPGSWSQVTCRGERQQQVSMSWPGSRAKTGNQRPPADAAYSLGNQASRQAAMVWAEREDLATPSPNDDGGTDLGSGEDGHAGS